MTTADIAYRVALRFSAAVASDDDIEALHDEATSIDAIGDELERRLGPLALLTVHDVEGTVRWEAISSGGTTIRGTASVGALLLDGRHHVWPVVEIAGAVGHAGERRGTTTPLPRQLLEQRLREVASRLRRILVEMRTNPQVPNSAAAKQIQKVVDLAEQD